MILHPDASSRIHVGHSLDVLRAMPCDSVHCCVTSPPYYKLRDYECEGQIGLEDTPEEFVANLVEVFREMRRVLRPDGTFWLVIGDSYASYGKNRLIEQAIRNSTLNGSTDGQCQILKQKSKITGDLKPKDLIGIPWMVAFALRSDGWWLRQDCVWAKPAPMPHPVTDRCTTSHEYVFLFAKSERYYFDHIAIAEPCVSTKGSGNGYKRPERLKYRNTDGTATGQDEQWNDIGGLKNKRSVWQVAHEGFKGSHYACYPTKLIEPCILAGTSEHGVCAACGSPYDRIVEKRKVLRERPNSLTKRTGEDGTGNHCPNDTAGVSVVTVGWEPSCKCNAEVIQATVLDPFSGAGTTGVVCVRNRRNYIGVELNPEYAEMSRERIESVSHKFNQNGAGSLFAGV